MIKVIYNKVCGRCVQSEPLTSGMVGQTIHFEYSHDFDGLTLTAVFTNGKTTVDVLNQGNQCVIPHEVLDTVGTLVKVGIYATRGNELVIPTIYATIGVVLKGADPSGDVSADPTLPVWAQIQGIIGNLNDLNTEAKNNLVAAVNEVKQATDGKQDKLIAGENITIAADGRTISATGGGGGSTVELDTTLSVAGKAADAKAVGDALDNVAFTNVIDTAKYGITAADYVAPFTASMYEVAYANGVGIQNAINDAKARGMERITLPAGNYPLCYHAAADDEYNAIIDARGIDFYGYDVKLYVIYDEEGTNPYFTGATPRLLQGTIISTDRDVCGFHLVGERRFRKDVNTKYRDCSAGIGLTSTVNGNTIKDCLIECVSGDGISNAGYMEQLAGWDDTFTSIEWDYTTGAYVESKYKFVSAEHGGDWIDKTRPLLIRNTGYFLYSSAPLIIRCWDSDGAYIGVVQFWQGEYFYLPENTAKWRLELTRVVEHETTATETWSFWIGYGTYSGTKIINCESRLNQRGGMSNLPNDVLVKDCYIHNNGNAGDGMVQYYDTTRFGIDIEDIWIHQITIDGSRIMDNFNNLLFRCGNVVLKQSIIGNVYAMNQVVDFYAEQCVFTGDVKFKAPTSFGNKAAIGCTFGGAISDSLLVLDNHALDSAELVGGNMVMRNTVGDTICTVDMSKIVPVELASDGLCMHFDFSVTPANPMQPVDLVNGLPIYNDDYTAANYSEDGVVLVNGAGSNGFKIASLDVTNHNNYAQIPEYATLKEMLRAGTGFTVECFSKQLIPIVLDGYNKGIEISGRWRNITLPYLNSDGVSTSGSSTSVSTFVDDAGNVYSTNNTAGQEAMGLDKGYHMVFTADESGTLKVYLNGFTGTGTVTCADFAGWDYDTILAPRYWMLCVDNEYDAQNPKTVKKLRMYNRALSIDEVRNNYRYELNYTPATSLAAATSDTLGGVKADPATEADTQPVRIGTDGKLYTAQSGGGGGGASNVSAFTNDAGYLTLATLPKYEGETQ